MVSCVVRGLSRSMVGGASLSYRHMMKRLVLNVPSTAEEFWLFGNVSTWRVDVELHSFVPPKFLSYVFTLP